jgi:hypothetical protein
MGGKGNGKDDIKMEMSQEDGGSRFQKCGENKSTGKER